MDEIEEIYRRYAPAVFRFAWGLSGNRIQAEDLVSETFVRLLTRAPSIRTQTALAYLLAIARNLHLTTQKRRQREIPLEGDFAAPEIDPGARLDDRARLDATVAALARLPEGERAALLLRADFDLPYEDVAAALGISETAAKVRVHRARARLTEMLKAKGIAQ
jgi:RNA polymerase sigma-70 factor (ECF subfamily)